MDATFGSAIQMVDKTLRALSIGTYRLFYHQGTVNQGKPVNSVIGILQKLTRFSFLQLVAKRPA